LKRNYEAFAVEETDAVMAAEIGQLMPMLSPRFGGEPLELSDLQERIDSPFHDQLVVIERSPEQFKETTRVIGAASMSLVIGSGVRVWGEKNRKAMLEDFVVHEDSRGTGAAELLWLACVAWCEEHGTARMEFTSEEHRVAARKFYQKMGAVITDDPHFVFEISQSESAEEAA
jgi:GNAT superfamily N-acetyltransferase